MSVLVRIPTPLQKLAGDKAELSVDAASLREVVEQLSAQNEEFKTRLLDDSGNLRRFVNVYVNEEDVRFLQKLDTPLKDGDEVSIVPAIAGGSQTLEQTSVLVLIPAVMRPTFGGQIEFRRNATTVGELIEGINKEYPEFRSRIFDKDGKLNTRNILVFVNQEDVRFLQKLDTPLNGGDEVSFVPAICGGSQTATETSVLARVPNALSHFFGGRTEIHLNANSVREVIERLGEENPDLRSRLIDKEGNLTRYVIVYVNEEDVRFLQKLDTPLKDGDEVSIVPAIHGG